MVLLCCCVWDATEASIAVSLSDLPFGLFLFSAADGAGALPRAVARTACTAATTAALCLDVSHPEQRLLGQADGFVGI